MNKRISILSLEHPLERFAFQALFAVLVLFLFAYLYFVTSSVFNVIARKEAETRAAQLESAIAALEHEYFALGEAIDADSAHTLGLAPISHTSYVYRPGTAVAVTIGSDDI